MGRNGEISFIWRGDQVGKSEKSRSLIIDMPLARLCIFVDGLVELKLDGVGFALFKSVKFQFLRILR
jgi:hypothetical protein